MDSFFLEVGASTTNCNLSDERMEAMRDCVGRGANESNEQIGGTIFVIEAIQRRERNFAVKMSI